MSNAHSFLNSLFLSQRSLTTGHTQLRVNQNYVPVVHLKSFVCDGTPLEESSNNASRIHRTR
jgi:hypothetical protein